MQLVTRAGGRSVLRTAPRSIQLSREGAEWYRLYTTSGTKSWTCKTCRLHQQNTTAWKAQTSIRRSFTTLSRRYDDTKRETPQPPTQRSSDEATPLPASSTTTAEKLPSYQASKRWHMSKRMEHLMNEVLSRVSVASHHINTYTGTDYSGIETLRKEISEQELRAKECLATVQDARHGHSEALTSQASAQKEIVALLERKSSWLPADLERYMSLVRSEHLNDQSVQSAKEHLKITERDLESARTLLERLERKQYHEEQIWSDTIRRNSTWVTFGLMGVNIFLLLAQLVIFEPHRRRKIVREVKAALDEKAISHHPIKGGEELDEVAVIAEIVAEASNAYSDLGMQNSAENIAVATATPTCEPTSTPALVESTATPEDASSGKTPSMNDGIPPHQAPDPRLQATQTWYTLAEACRDGFWDLFSERLIQLKKVDMTRMVLESAAVGVAATGVALWLVKSR